jgi:tetratricopeptide (TPR) repeat protein
VNAGIAGGRRCIVLAAVLAALVIAVYGRAGGFGFLAFDDDVYVTANPFVKAGLSAAGFAWSFSFEAKDKTYWHPLTWLSHMLDVELFGLDPAGHHGMNVVLHAVGVVLLFHVLRRMTQSVWSSFVVAALFAVHPLNVEGVAWVAERKNVLATVFWMLSLNAYLAYVAKPGMLRYGILVSVFAAGLLAKPMLVTLPAVLVLMDYWPLGRLKSAAPRGEGGGRGGPLAAGPSSMRPAELIMEKIPLLLLAVLVAVLANASLKGSGAEISFERVPLAFRLLHAPLACLLYAFRIVWPSELAVFYPYPQSIPLLPALAALGILGAATAAAWRRRSRQPYLLFGWAWFLFTLVPVLGLLQAGLWPAMADRWAGIPSIGLFVAAVWGVSAAMRRHGKWAARLGAAAATGILLAFAAAAYRQLAVWSGDLPLFQSALARTEANFVAHHNLGAALYRMGERSEGLRHLREAARIDPLRCLAHYLQALSRLPRELPEEAEQHALAALEIKPQAAPGPRKRLSIECRPAGAVPLLADCRVVLGTGEAERALHNGIGVMLLQLGRREAAEAAFRDALRIDPRDADALSNLGWLLDKLGKREEAIGLLERVLAIDPSHAAARQNLHDARQAAAAAAFEK